MKTLAFIFALFVSSAFAGPVSHFGMLKVCGKNLCGEKTGTTTPVFFKGPSLFWSSGLGALFYSPDVVDWFVDNMQIGVIRAAMGIQYYKENSEPLNAAGTVMGYYYDPATQKKMIKTVIDAAILNDIYVVVDWHSHNAHSGTEPTLARTFFTELANEYKNVPNIIWELYNEPVSAKVGDITTYANGIITALRNAGNNNLVLVGSPAWSQNPSNQASNYGNTASSKNVAFTFHFYADEHPQSGGIGSSATSAMSSGYAVFGSEWGTVRADGGGSVNVSASNTWTTWMDNNKISNCMWSASDINEGSAMFKNGTSPLALSTSRLTTNGEYFQTYMGKNKWTAQIPNNNPKAGDVTVSVKDGESVTITSASLDIDGTIESISEPKDAGGTVYGTAEKSGTGIKYTTSQAGSPEKVKFTYTVSKSSKTTQGRVVVNITNLKPKLPPVNPISVSRKSPTKLSLVNSLKAGAPKDDKFTLESVSLSETSKGTASKISAANAAGDTIVFTPSAAMATKDRDEVTLSYTVKNNAGITSTASVVLEIQNQAPTIVSNLANCAATIEQGTEETRLALKSHFGGRDKDDDPIWFDAFYLASAYPGSLTKVAQDTLVYKRNGNNNSGNIILLAYATDGMLQSGLGKIKLCLKGSGNAINVPDPTEIPGQVPIISKPGSTGFGIKSIGRSIEVNFEQNGFAKLDVYSLSGKNMGTLLNGFQNAGSKEISLKNLNLQKGIYILRLKQGSQIKTLRVAN
ncbi:MAG: cellulase family glycosylhydrolase [Candidatus Fibromonas sp.]|jgi:hypothetical protein|nr:cellulase family glycosylhydrolase [Candidatus Fibromonas sp.]